MFAGFRRKSLESLKHFKLFIFRNCFAIAQKSTSVLKCRNQATMFRIIEVSIWYHRRYVMINHQTKAHQITFAVGRLLKWQFLCIPSKPMFQYIFSLIGFDNQLSLWIESLTDAFNVSTFQLTLFLFPLQKANRAKEALIQKLEELQSSGLNFDSGTSCRN